MDKLQMISSTQLQLYTGKVIEQVRIEKQKIAITWRDKPQIVIIPIKEYEELEEAARSGRFKKLMRAGSDAVMSVKEAFKLVEDAKKKVNK